MPLRRADGFTLLEVVIASAILLLACAGTSGTLLMVLRGERMTDEAAVLEQALSAKQARLRALPFAPGSGTERSLCAVVFPHADATRNTATARYIARDEGDGEDGGGFVTDSVRAWGVLRVRARFVRRDGEAPVVPGDTLLDEWSAEPGTRLPAACLVVELEAIPSDSGLSPVHLRFVRRVETETAQNDVSGAAP